MKELKQLAKILGSLTVVTALSTACSNPRSPLHSEISPAETGIMGGSPATSEDEISKSTVALESDAQGVFCTGVLISKNLIVTAAHCTAVTTRPNQMRVVFGLDLNGKLEKRQVLGGQVPDQWPQLKNDQDRDWGDIALLRFDGEIPQGYAPVPVLKSSRSLKVGMSVLISGYGMTSMRPLVDPEKLMQATVQMSDLHYSNSEFKFDLIDGKGACHGDSGGPAFVKIKNKLYLLGITSRSATLEGSATCMDGSIYTSVPAEVPFLKKAAEALNSKSFVPNERIPQPEAGF